MNIELYINQQLCDIESPKNFSIFLKRQFLNPTELNTKDAQKSYSITLPATGKNNEIFGYKNVEEVSGKFKIYPKAKLYIGGVLILDGKFMLTEITRNGYRGNLGVPKRKEVKDIFGHMVMNEAGEWLVKGFKGFETISQYNQMDKSPFIFPLVLYGLLPKEGLNGYTDKDLLDRTVRLGLDDFLPSVNCVEMLKKIFNNSGYNLSGTALADERINNLYVSYKNPNDYQFNWGAHNIRLDGNWRYYKAENAPRGFESYYQENTDTSQLNVNVFKSRHHDYTIQEDNGGSITRGGRESEGGVFVNIPYSGLYKVELYCTVNIGNNQAINYRNIGVDKGELNTAPMEIHLVRNLDKALNEITFNNKFAYENIPQYANSPYSKFPQPNRVNFIDPKQDKNLICGFSFGRNGHEDYRNPLNESNCNPMAISGGRSWDFESGEGTTYRAYSAVESPSYINVYNDITGDFIVELDNTYTHTKKVSEKTAEGQIQQVIWLEKGDRLDLLFSTTTRSFGSPSPIFKGISDYSINYNLKITPFQENLDWLKMDNTGSSTKAMNWNDEASFIKEQIDLIKALPSEVKINDWIENFCKAFNLDLHDTGDGFSLDLKDRGTVKNTSIIIDLDSKTSVKQSSNQPLNAPYSYNLGFTIDSDEEGYYRTQDNGGGIFIADSEASTTVTQTSTFSYNWFKAIRDGYGNNKIDLPVITDREIWEYDYDYKDMMSKLYLDKAQRFWYKSGVNEIPLYNNSTQNSMINALVSNKYTGAKPQRLDYRNSPNSIMKNFFILLTNEKNYTLVECYLTPEEYSNLHIALIRFNGDLYNVAEIDGYDPLGRNKAKLKLIRKI